MRRTAQPYRLPLRPVHRRFARPHQRPSQKRWFPTVTATITTVARVSLQTGFTPETRTLHKIKFRAKKASGTGVVTLLAALYEGASNRSGDLESSALTTSFADYTLTIADAAAASIGGYSDLEIRFWARSTTGDVIDVDVAEIYLETPAGIPDKQYTHRIVKSQALHRSYRW